MPFYLPVTKSPSGAAQYNQSLCSSILGLGALLKTKGERSQFNFLPNLFLRFLCLKRCLYILYILNLGKVFLTDAHQLIWFQCFPLLSRI